MTKDVRIIRQWYVGIIILVVSSPFLTSKIGFFGAISMVAAMLFLFSLLQFMKRKLSVKKQDAGILNVVVIFGAITVVVQYIVASVISHRWFANFDKLNLDDMFALPMVSILGFLVIYCEIRIALTKEIGPNGR